MPQREDRAGGVQRQLDRLVRQFVVSAIAGRIVVVDQILLDLKTSVLVFFPMHADTVLLVLVKALLLVVIVKPRGQVLGLADIDPGVRMPAIVLLCASRDEVDRAIVLFEARAPRVGVELILLSRLACERDCPEL